MEWMLYVWKGIVAYAAVGFSLAMINDWVESLRYHTAIRRLIFKLHVVLIAWVIFFFLWI